ncbi:MAG: ComEC/Rec2 family competence protein [bacterium]|nr:ComEC/Rec2 family competence protein [bacterium]
MNFKDKKIVLGGIILLLIFNILAWFVVYDLSKIRYLEVIFFDVAQGDAIFIKTPQGHQILIDGGPDSVILEKLGKELPFYDRTIDLVILTHPESDHLTGLLDVLRSYKVKNILWTGILIDSAGFKKWAELIKQENAKIYIAQSGQKITIGKTSFEILIPFENLENKSVKDANNTSIVLRLDFGEISLLFTGDIYKSAERELLSLAKQLDTDVLKVGHHGSKTSTAEEFIIVVSPEIAVISVGRNNSYGHPYQETLDTLEKYGIRIFRTDLNGDIKIISDGINYGVSNFQN